MKTITYKKSKLNDGYELLSDCCSAPPENGIYYEDGWNDDASPITGRCSKCKDGSGFQWYKNED